jgi:phosphatidylinositol-bisphosphatase
LESGDLLLAQYIQKCLDTGDDFDYSILLGTQDSDQEKPSDSTSTTLDTQQADNSPIARRKSREDEAIDSLKQSDVPNTIEEQTASIDDIESEGLNCEVSPTIGANSMIDVLVAFLECLPEPVIPSSLHKRLIDGTLSPNVTQVHICRSSLDQIQNKSYRISKLI